MTHLLSFFLRPAPQLSLLPADSCLELPTAAAAGFAEHEGMPLRPRSLPEGAHVLIVSATAPARTRVEERVRAVHPAVVMEGAASFTDAVLRLAQGGVDLVLLDQAHLPPLSAAAPLLLRGLVPEVRLLLIGAQQHDPGFESVDDLAALEAWLRALV